MKVNRHSVLLFGRLAAAAFFMPAISGASETSLSFDVSGTIGMQNYRVDGKYFKTFSGTFRCRRSGNSWSITYKYDGQETSEEFTFDGRSVYGLLRNLLIDEGATPPNSLGVPHWKKEGKTYTSVPSGTIADSGAYPAGASCMTRCVWLALLSDIELKGASIAAIPAPWGTSAQPDVDLFQADVHYGTSRSSLPESISFIAREAKWNGYKTDFYLRGLALVNRRSPFPDGFLGGTFRVTQWTNSFVTLPLAFEIIRYYPPSKSGEQELRIAERYLGIVQNLAPAAGPVNAPGGFSRADVVDGRFATPDFPMMGVRYSITNGTWLATDKVDTALVSMARSNYVALLNPRAWEQRPPKPENRSNSAAARTVVIAFMLLSAIVALWVFGAIKFRTQSSKQQ